MAVVIRLRSTGTKKKIKHRIVVTDSKFPRDGRFLDTVGYWDPSKTPTQTKLDTEKVQDWMKKGAQPSETVRSILKKAGMKLT